MASDHATAPAATAARQPPTPCSAPARPTTVEGTWPVSAVAGGPYATSHVEREVQRVSRHPNAVHVWRARVTDLTEMDFIPARTVEAELKPKET
jgi:hypothetical protein